MKNLLHPLSRHPEYETGVNANHSNVTFGFSKAIYYKRLPSHMPFFVVGKQFNKN
jgi:hypothetical protein